MGEAKVTNSKRIDEKTLGSSSSASSQQKWKYGSCKVSIASERLLENENSVYNQLRKVINGILQSSQAHSKRVVIISLLVF